MDDLDRLYHRLLDAVRDGAPHLRERRFRLGDISQHLVPYRLYRRELGFEGVGQYEHALARLAAGERGYLSADASVQQAFRRAADEAAGGDGEGLGATLRTYGDALVALAPGGRHADESSGDAPGGNATAPQPPDAVVGAAPATTAAAEPSAAGSADAATSDVPNEPAAGRAAPDRVGARGDARGDVVDAGGLVIPIVPVDAGASSAAPTPAEGARAEPPRAEPAPPPSPAAMPFPVRPPSPVFGGHCPHCGKALPPERGVTFCPYCGENLTVRRCPACSTELEAGWRFCITCGRGVDEPAAAGAGT